MGSFLRHWLQNQRYICTPLTASCNKTKINHYPRTPTTRTGANFTSPQPNPTANPYSFPTYPQNFSTVQNRIGKPQTKPNPVFVYKKSPQSPKNPAQIHLTHNKTLLKPPLRLPYSTPPPKTSIPNSLPANPRHHPFSAPKLHTT